MSHDFAALDRTLDTLKRRLLESRTRSGHWEGYLSSSALSTATATVALTLAARGRSQDHSALVQPGLNWLIANQNEDGGWGDTVCSLSNLSTTLLAWSALSFAPEPGEEARAAIERAERWLRSQLGDLTPQSLKSGILERYGKDRTFSVPILTVLALTGKLGPASSAWRLVPQLPFELAACPHGWFRWLRLPVVSYAVPALVAIGQARHHHAPARNPLAAFLRSALRAQTLGVTREMQPESGGYLEAVPLTAFVVMNLIDCGRADDLVVTNGIRFLVNSARHDGSWPIDTNLATWVTTLSIDALGGADELPPDELPNAERRQIVEWLLGQQVRQEHPFTHAQPGGWAWTNLSGGVPDADDTAGALIALWKLSGSEHLDASVAGVNWLLNIQNADGGIPTFCRGWGALPFDRSAADLTAHALRAWSVWHSAVPLELQRRISRAAGRAVSYLVRQQRTDGSWAPLWFGNQKAADQVNLTYGTARVVEGLAASLPIELAVTKRIRQLELRWLLNAQNADGGWGGGAGLSSSIEETGLALRALAAATALDASGENTQAMWRGVQWIVEATGEGRHTPPSAIGLYFARLWYSEKLYPFVFALGGLSRARSALTKVLC